MAPYTRALAKPDQSKPGSGLLWWLSVTICGFAALFFALATPHIFSQPLKVGDIADQDLIAPYSTQVVDELATRRGKAKARDTVIPVFKRSHELDKSMLDCLSHNLELVSSLKRGVGLAFSDSSTLNTREKVYLLECPEQTWQTILQAATATSTTAQATNHLRIEILPQVESSLLAKLSPKQQKSVRSKNVPYMHNAREKRHGYDTNQFLSTYSQARQEYQELVPKPNAATHNLLLLAASVDNDKWPSYRDTIIKATVRLLHSGILFPGASRTDWEQTAFEFLPDTWNETVRLTSAQVIASVLEPNLVVDTQATRKKTEAALAKVGQELKAIHAGQIIVPRGNAISQDELEALRSCGITHQSNWSTLMSLGLSLFAAFLLVGIFLYTYEPKHLFSANTIGLMLTVSVATAAVAVFVGSEYPQFIPIPAASLVLKVFFGPRIAFFLPLLLMIFISVDGLLPASQLVALATASIGAVLVNIKQRKNLAIAGVVIGLLQAGGYLAASLLGQSFLAAPLLPRELIIEVLGGLSSCIVAIGSLPFLENIFGMVTPFRLAELTDATQPLLRQLEEHAPGTYQHSLAVANLAEAAARSIGADVNLVRAGALYHDIGKMVRPKYFIENQLGAQNPHDAISPEESRDRVLAHVTDGLALAKKYDLPRAVGDFIPQHQGTTLMAYFYHKACLRDGINNVDTNFFRYPGPKPQTKEAAIVMLADVSEAVTHSLKDPTQEEIELSISSVFKARWDDGQFAETGLTLTELEKIKKAFARVWRTLHHERLKYPSTTTGKMPIVPEHSVQAPPATP